MSSLYWLSETQIERIKPYFPPQLMWLHSVSGFSIGCLTRRVLENSVVCSP